MKSWRKNTFTDNPRRWLIAIILLSVVLRLGAAFLLGDEIARLPGTADQVSYHTLAQRVLGGHGFTFERLWWPATKAGEPTAHWSFLYTLYLVVVYAVFGPHPLAARLIQALVVGVLHPWLAYKLAKKIFNPSVGMLAALLTSVYIYFIYYAATLMTEPFYITLIVLALFLTVSLVERLREPGGSQEIALTLALGLALGATVLLRQLFLLFVPFLLLWLWWAAGRKLRPVLLATALMVGMVLPFTLYNYARFDRFVLLNTNSGYAFFWANHPIHGDVFKPILPSATYYNLIPADLLKLDEAALDQALLKLGVQFVLDDPIRYLKLSLSRIPSYFMFWPSSGSGTISNVSRVAGFGLLWPFMLFGALRACFVRRWSLAGVLRSPVFLLHFFMLVYSAIHILTWALIRYRLPVDAIGIVFASYAMVTLGAQFWGSSHAPRPVKS